MQTVEHVNLNRYRAIDITLTHQTKGSTCTEMLRGKYDVRGRMRMKRGHTIRNAHSKSLGELIYNHALLTAGV